MDRHESFIDSIVNEVLSLQPLLTSVMGNDGCWGVWIPCAKEKEAAFVFTYRVIDARTQWPH